MKTVARLLRDQTTAMATLEIVNPLKQVAARVRNPRVSAARLIAAPNPCQNA